MGGRFECWGPKIKESWRIRVIPLTCLHLICCDLLSCIIESNLGTNRGLNAKGISGPTVHLQGPRKQKYLCFHGLWSLMGILNSDINSSMRTFVEGNSTEKWNIWIWKLKWTNLVLAHFIEFLATIKFSPIGQRWCMSLQTPFIINLEPSSEFFLLHAETFLWNH